MLGELLSVVSLGAMGWGAVKVFGVNRISNWPTETGSVRSEPRVVDKRLGCGVETDVTFRVEGKTYTCRRYSFTKERFSRKRAEDIASRYWEGVMASVRYHPRDPSRCAMEYHLPALPMWTLVGGGILFFVSLGFWGHAPSP